MASLENDIMLIKQSLYELAENMGDSLTTPKSFSLLCLTFDIPWDLQSKIVVAFRNVELQDFEDKSNEEIISGLRNKLAEIHPPAKEFSDAVIFAFARVISEHYVEELFPVTSKLKDEFSVNPTISK